MTQSIDRGESRSPRRMSDEYRCIVELLRDQNQFLNVMALRLELMHETLKRAIKKGSLSTPASKRGDQRPMEDTQTEASLSSGPPQPDNPPGEPGIEIEAPLGGQTATQHDEAEKARRIRHGEGLDLDEPQF